MKLWLVTAEIQAVMASDEEPEIADAECALREEVANRNDLAGLVVGWIGDPKDLPLEWKKALPHVPTGADPQERTCSQILEAAKWWGDKEG